MGCARVKGFENYGLRTRNSPENTEDAWLITPHSSQVAMSKDPSGEWVVEADNLLVNEAIGQ